MQTSRCFEFDINSTSLQYDMFTKVKTISPDYTEESQAYCCTRFLFGTIFSIVVCHVSPSRALLDTTK